GLLAAAAAVSVQGALVAGVPRRWWLAPLGVLAALAGVGVVAAIGPREGLGRLLATTATDVSLGGRLEEYRAALGLWTRFPLTGTGLGAFRDAFPLVQTPTLEGTWWHPHNDFLEVLVTAGLVGLGLVAVGIWGLLRGLGRVLREGVRSEDRAASLAALGALVSAGIHESLDFGLSMPGNAVTLLILLGASTTSSTWTPALKGEASRSAGTAPPTARRGKIPSPAPSRRSSTTTPAGGRDAKPRTRAEAGSATTISSRAVPRFHVQSSARQDR